VIERWSALKGMSLHEAAEDLITTFNLEPARAKATEKRNG
jgi:hypothetical protein